MLGPLFLPVTARPCDPCPEQLKGQACGGGLCADSGTLPLAGRGAGLDGIEGPDSPKPPDLLATRDIYIQFKDPSLHALPNSPSSPPPN